MGLRLSFAVTAPAVSKATGDPVPLNSSEEGHRLEVQRPTPHEIGGEEVGKIQPGKKNETLDFFSGVVCIMLGLQSVSRKSFWEK